MKENAYEEIRNLEGAGEFFELISRWDAISEKLREKKTPKNYPVLLPDLLWSAKPGSGTSKALNLMEEYLVHKENLMEFSGNVRSFQFKLAYCRPNAPFKELQRLFEAISNAKGFRSVYKGIIVIDIDEWQKHFEERYFIDFMHFLSDNSCPWLIVLCTTNDDPVFLDKLEGILSLFLRVERVVLRAPDVKELSEYCVKYLAGYGISLRKNAVRLIEESMQKMQKSAKFNGYNAATRFCQDIIYSLLCHSKDTSEEIGAGSLKEFAPDSEYIRKRAISENTIFDRKIGF